MNSKESFKGFVTFIILISIVSVTVVTFNFVVNKGNFKLQTKASDSDTIPSEIQVKNVTQNSAEIIWVTNLPNIGELAYGKEKINDCSKNTCLIASENIETDIHSIKLSGLDPNTTYFYKIKVGNKFYPLDTVTSFSTTDSSGVAEVSIEIVEPPKRKLNDQVDPEFEDSGVVSTSNSDTDGNGTVPPDGYYNDNPLKQGPFNYVNDSKDQVLGASTDVLNEQIIEEFKEALVYQDKNYDFNRDGTITNQDYPLFIEFIINQE